MVIGSMILDESRFVVTNAGKSQTLTKTEFYILKALLQSSGRVITFEELDLRVNLRRSDEQIDSARLRSKYGTHIFNLRRKLDELGVSTKIESVYGRGVRFDLLAQGTPPDALVGYLIENAPEIMGLIDSRGVIVYITPSVQSILGYVPSDFIGKRYTEFMHLVHPDERAALLELWRSAVFLKRMTARIQRRSGDYVWMEMLGYQPPKHQDAVTFSMRDMTDWVNGRALEHLGQPMT
jgi:PAS domain S-box-containing protein